MKTSVVWLYCSLAILLSLHVLGCGGVLDAKKSVDGRIEWFHQLYNSGRHFEIYSAAHAELQREGSAQAAANYLSSIHQKLGNVVSTKTERWKYLNSGDRIRIWQKTKYERGEATEVFTFVLDGSNMILAHYAINSKQLSVEVKR